MRFFGKGAVAIVVIDQHCNRLKNVGMAISSIAFAVLTAPHIIPVPLNVAQNNKIKQSIVIKIDPGCARRPSTAANTSFSGDIGERAISIIVVELVTAICSHVEIFAAIIVVIACGYSHAVACALQTRFLGYIFEASIGLLMVQTIPVLRACLLRDRSLRRRITERRAIHKEQIEPSVVVVVKQGNAGAHRLDKIFFRSVRSLMLKTHARRIRHFYKIARNKLIR